MEKLINNKRWDVAQDYELQWWSNYSDSIEWYKGFSDEIITETSPFIDINQNTVILEIGSGAAGGITYIKSNNKYAIDPLENFFNKNKSWVQFRDKKVNYLQGKGEALPFEDSFFDLIIIDNVLDHCDNPIAVLNEINRSLKIGGLIFFRQNVYNKWGKLLRTIMELLTIDKGHPFTFTKQYLINNINERNWDIKQMEEYGYIRSWKNSLLNLTFKGIIQTIFFIIRNRTLFILTKS